MMDSVWLVLAATWVKQGHGGAGAWTVILIGSAAGALVVVPNATPIILLALQLPWQTFAAAAVVTGFGNMLFNMLWETRSLPPQPGGPITVQRRVPDRLGASLTQFVGQPAYGLPQLRDDLERFVFLLGGSDGEPLFGP